MSLAPPLGGFCTPTRTKKRSYPERDVQKAIQQAFKARHNIVLVHVDPGAGRQNGGGRYSALPAGFPDLVGVIPPTGRAIYIEVKAPGNKPTTIQIQMLELLRDKGAIAMWADSVDSALCQLKDQLSTEAA